MHLTGETMRYYDFRHYHIRPMHTAREYMGKYPKFLLFFITIILSYLIFSSSASLPFRHTIVSLGYIGTFIAGVFFFILGYIHFKKCELKKKV